VNFKLDDEGNMYVLDKGNSKLQKFDSEGNFVARIATSGVGEADLMGGSSLAIKDDLIYVTDMSANSVKIFNVNGDFVEIILGFSYPQGITVDKNDNLYVYNSATHQIRIFGNPVMGLDLEDDISEFDMNEGDVIEYDIVMSSPINQNVTVNIGKNYQTAGLTNKIFSAVFASGEDQLNINPDPVVFTPDNWMIPQHVVVEAINDEYFDGNYEITLSHNTSSGATYYNGLALGDITINLADTDGLAPTGLKIIDLLILGFVLIGTVLIVRKFSNIGLKESYN